MATTVLWHGLQRVRLHGLLPLHSFHLCFELLDLPTSMAYTACERAYRIGGIAVHESAYACCLIALTLVFAGT